MKKIAVILLTFYFWLTVPTYSFAQQQNAPVFEVGISGNYLRDWYYDFFGIGITAKFLRPRKKNNNYLTYGMAYDLLLDIDPGYTPDVFHFINATGGYRIMMNSFFIEPQLGLGIAKEGRDQPYFETLVGIEAGWHVNNFTLSLNPRLMTLMDIFGGDAYYYLGLKGAIRLGRKP